MRNAAGLRDVVLGLAIVLGAAWQLHAEQPLAPPADDQAMQIFLAEPSGLTIKPLVVLPDYRDQGSPAWSPDGKLIAFDSWRPALGETHVNAKIVLVNSDGSNPRVLGDGAMPAFSPRSGRLAISRYSPNQGVWIMSSEGPAKELTLLDAEGWGTDWSPDGRQIVYARYEAGAANLVLYDLVEGTRTSLFDEGASPYGNFFWNFTWSPDGRYIVFKGLKADGTYEVAMVDARGARHGLIVCLDGERAPNFGWSHDSTRLFFSQVPERGGRPQIHFLNPLISDTPQLLPGQDPERTNVAAVPSPDGKKLLLVGHKRPVKKAK